MRIRGSERHWTRGAGMDDTAGAYRSTSEIKALLADGRRIRVAY